MKFWARSALFLCLKFDSFFFSTETIIDFPLIMNSVFTTKSALFWNSIMFIFHSTVHPYKGKALHKSFTKMNRRWLSIRSEICIQNFLSSIYCTKEFQVWKKKPFFLFPSLYRYLSPPIVPFGYNPLDAA